MNKLTNTSKMSLMLVALMLGFGFAACKKDEEDSSGGTKTLTKSKLYDKKWYNQGSTITFDLKSNGTIGSNNLDKWSWINNSDTLLLDYDGIPDQKWIFEWTEDTEMSTRLPGGNSKLFKTSKW